MLAKPTGNKTRQNAKYVYVIGHVMSGRLYFLSSAGREEALLLFLNVVLYLLFIKALKLHVPLKRWETVFYKSECFVFTISEIP